ncbi:MAG: DUF1444 family protein [Firmicutes bacterium]|nr:DUF1444 family protein [Bacillota bacterium]
MRLNKKRFELKLFNDVREKYEGAELDDNMITFKYGSLEIMISVSDMYKLYNEEKNYYSVKLHCLKVIQETIEEKRFKLDYSKVLPLIKSAFFGIEEDTDFIRDKLTPDLDILYVVDLGDVYRFITYTDCRNIGKLRESALKNLNKVYNAVITLDKELDIYSLTYTNDLTATMILSEKIVNQIYKRVGKRFLFAIPDSGTIIITKNQYKGIDYLKELIKVCPKVNEISDNVYLYNDGKISFADKSNIFKVIK